MPTVLRPLSTGELLDRTFFLYRKHFMLFVGIVALPNLASLALQLAGVVTRDPAGAGAVAARVGWMLLTMLVYVLALAASTSATVVAVSQVHLERPTSVSGAYSTIKSRIPHLLLIMVAVWMGVAVGFLLLIVPAIIFLLMWSLTIPVAVIENKGLRQATSRSAFLTKGNRGRIFIVYFLFTILTYIVTLLWETPLLMMVGLRPGTNPASIMGTVQVVAAIGSFVTNCLVGPLLTIALSLIYYDERVRKEAFDLEVMMASLDQTPSRAAAVADAM